MESVLCWLQTYKGLKWAKVTSPLVELSWLSQICSIQLYLVKWLANNYYCHWNAANIFGKPKTNTDFLPYKGDGFKIQLPSKWNPSKEVEYPGQVLRYEDNFDTTTMVAVMVTKTDKKSITDFGSPEEFLSKVQLTHLTLSPSDLN